MYGGPLIESEEREGAYSIRDKAGSLDTRGLDSLEEVDHTLCLESFQLRVETDECPCPPHSITEGKCGEEGDREDERIRFLIN